MNTPHTSQLLKLERHAYAPELNTIHLTNGETISAQGLTNIADCKTLLRTEARKPRAKHYFLTGKINPTTDRGPFASHTHTGRPLDIHTRLSLYKQLKAALNGATPARTFFHTSPTFTRRDWCRNH